MKRRTTYAFCLLLGCVVLAGCEKEHAEPSVSSPIKVNVITADTKSQPITLDDLRVAGNFVMDAYLDDPYEKYGSDGKPEEGKGGEAGLYINSKGEYNVFYRSADWNLDPSYAWVAHDMTRFWCYYPENAAIDSESEGKRSITTPETGKSVMYFSYELPAACSSSPYNDATNQQDILFAYAGKEYIDEEQSTDDIDIEFNHPLSEIRFSISPDNGTYDMNLVLKSIQIINVKKKGDCTFNGTGKIEPAEGETPMFVWNTSSYGTESYKQDYNATFSHSMTDWVYDAGDAEETFHTYTCKNAFMLIPQTLSGARLSVTFGNTGTGSDITVENDLPAWTWLPGHFYIYRIMATTIGRTVTMKVSLDEWGHNETRYIF